MQENILLSESVQLQDSTTANSRHPHEGFIRWSLHIHNGLNWINYYEDKNQTKSRKSKLPVSIIPHDCTMNSYTAGLIKNHESTRLKSCQSQITIADFYMIKTPENTVRHQQKIQTNVVTPSARVDQTEGEAQPGEEDSTQKENSHAVGIKCSGYNG